MKVLVCGGRTYDNRDRFFSLMDNIHSKRMIHLIIHGDARGADALADEWARTRHVARVIFPANWDGEALAAGPNRNARMLHMSNPDAVVAFPGGTGTAHMVQLAKETNVPLYEVEIAT